MDPAFLARAIATIQSSRPPTPPPLTLDDTTRELYERAVADPSSLSEEERRGILQKPHREEEDSLCHDICGFTMPELVAKAVQYPNSLSYLETDLIVRGVSKDRNKKRLDEAMRLIPTDKDLWHKASNAATTEDEHVAKKTAWAKRNEQHNARNAASEIFDSSDSIIIKNVLTGVPWQDHIMSSSASTKTLAPCGFVVFYPKEQAINWSTFKEKMEKSVSLGFHRYLSLVKEPIMRGFKLQDVPHNSSESLVSHFVAMRGARNIPAGLRQDVFLYLDDEAFQSLKLDKPFIWLWEPQEQSVLQEQLGTVKVDIKHIAPLLLMRLTQRDMSLEGRQLLMWRCEPDLEGFHAAAASSTNESLEHVRIWPPRTIPM
ncbi:unnamed protein product [Fusarium graminearum]|nr:unnamed protein product [Fusarium graminearum]